MNSKPSGSTGSKSSRTSSAGVLSTAIIRGERIAGIGGRNLSLPSTGKKMVAPKIPQRRVKVKEEIHEPADESSIKSDPQTSSSSRGRKSIRGRGERSYIQTEGTLTVGKAMAIKRETQESCYERSSSSRSIKREGIDMKMIDLKKVNELLDSCNEPEVPLDCGNDSFPVKWPIPNLKCKNVQRGTKSKVIQASNTEINKEIKSEEIKQEIKEEFDEEIRKEADSEFKLKIKKEPLDSDEVKQEETKSSFAEVTVKNEVSDAKLLSLIEDMKLSKDIGKNQLILFQLPSSLPFPNEMCDAQSSTDKSKTTKEQSGHPDAMKSGPSLNELPDGYVGKLQFMKSGRIRLVMGSNVMTVTEAIDSNTKWDVASVDPDTGHFTLLGDITKKVLVTPTID